MTNLLSLPIFIDTIHQVKIILRTELDLEIKNKEKSLEDRLTKGKIESRYMRSPWGQFRCYDDLIINLRKLQL